MSLKSVFYKVRDQLLLPRSIDLKSVTHSQTREPSSPAYRDFPSDSWWRSQETFLSKCVEDGKPWSNPTAFFLFFVVGDNWRIAPWANDQEYESKHFFLLLSLSSSKQNKLRRPLKTRLFWRLLNDGMASLSLLRLWWGDSLTLFSWWGRAMKNTAVHLNSFNTRYISMNLRTENGQYNLVVFYFLSLILTKMASGAQRHPIRLKRTMLNAQGPRTWGRDMFFTFVTDHHYPSLKLSSKSQNTNFFTSSVHPNITNWPLRDKVVY